jgi:glutamate-ammonia-ligase adenylyltransferase
MMAQCQPGYKADRRQHLRQAIAAHSPDLEPRVIAELFQQLDTDYFDLFSVPEIADHLKLLTSVDEKHPVQINVRHLRENRAELRLAAYDFMGSFSLITGLMAIYGLNIRAGHVFSYETGPGRKTPWGYVEGGLIIDVFTVEWRPAQKFDAAAQASFCTELNDLLQFLRQDQWQQARDALNYRLIDAIRASDLEFSGRLLPVEISIDNTISPDWTVVYIHADDTPGFLYSLSNALSMRNIYIHRIEIQSFAGSVRDTLYLSRQRGGKIVSDEAQRELRIIVSLIKQFTHFLTAAPDPAMALRHFDQLMDRLDLSSCHPQDIQWLCQEQQFKTLATVLGSSDFLWEDFLRMHASTLMPILQNVETTDRRRDQADLWQQLQGELSAALTSEARKQMINNFKDCEMFRIDIRHLMHAELPFGEFSAELTDLAEVVLRAALDLAEDQTATSFGMARDTNTAPLSIALFALGKFGGREMGYASDIELLCVYEPRDDFSGEKKSSAAEYAEMVVRQLLSIISARQAGIFEIDLRLRPFGSHGSLATSVDTFCQYYREQGGAAPFERQALIKLRWVAGDSAIGHAIEHQRDLFVYADLPFDRETATKLRQRQIDELVRLGATDVKYSRGGMVDIEYTVQYLQLMHGASYPQLHTTNTLDALDALYDARLLGENEFQQLRSAYVFLRLLIDALRIVRGHARDLVLPDLDSDEFIFLARRMGYWDQQGTPTLFAADIKAHMQHAGSIYQDRFLT